MPRRNLTSGRKFSTTTSAPSVSFLKILRSETGNARIDDARIGFLQRLVIDAETELDVRPEILDHHVGAVGQLFENLEIGNRKCSHRRCADWFSSATRNRCRDGT